MPSNPQGEASEAETKPRANRPGRPRGLAWLLGPALAVAVAVAVAVGAVALPEGQSQGAVLSQATTAPAPTGLPTGTAAPTGAAWNPGAASYVIDASGCTTTQTATVTASSAGLATTIAGVLSDLNAFSNMPNNTTVRVIELTGISVSGSTVSLTLNGWVGGAYCSGAGNDPDPAWTRGAIAAVAAAAAYGAVISTTVTAITAAATNAGYPAPTVADLSGPIAGLSQGASVGMAASVGQDAGWQQTLSSAVGGAVIGAGIDGLPAKYLGHYIGDGLYPVISWSDLTGDISADATQAGVDLDTVTQTMYTTVSAAALPDLQVPAGCRVGYRHSCFPGGNRFSRPSGIALPAGGIPGILLKGRTA